MVETTYREEYCVDNMAEINYHGEYRGDNTVEITLPVQRGSDRMDRLIY